MESVACTLFVAMGAATACAAPATSFTHADLRDVFVSRLGDGYSVFLGPRAGVSLNAGRTWLPVGDVSELFVAGREVEFDSTGGKPKAHIVPGELGFHLDLAERVQIFSGGVGFSGYVLAQSDVLSPVAALSPYLLPAGAGAVAAGAMMLGHSSQGTTGPTAGPASAAPAPGAWVAFGAFASMRLRKRARSSPSDCEG